MCSCQLRTQTFFNFDKTKADSQADLSLSWAHRSVCFEALWLSLMLFLFFSSQVKEIDGKSFAATCEYCKDSTELSLSRIHGRFIQTATCEYCKGSIELSLWRIHGRFIQTATCEYCKGSVRLSLCRIHGRFIQRQCYRILRGARWLSGRVSDSGARGPGFETYRRRVVSLSKTLYSPKVLVNYPGSDGSVPTWLKNCWLGR